jgi:hypothetical protein
MGSYSLLGRSEQPMNLKKAMQLCIVCSFAFLAMACQAQKASLDGTALKYKWFYLSINLLPAENVTKTEALMKHAASLGYNGVLLDDYKFNILDRMEPVYFQHAEQIKTTAKKLGIEIIPSICPVGYSDGMLIHDPNLVEPLPVHDAVFGVRNGEADVLPSGNLLKNGGFEMMDGNKAIGWTFQDDPGKVSFADSSVYHEGKLSLRLENPHSGNAQNERVMQSVKLVPYHYYLLTFWAKTHELVNSGNVNVLVLPDKKDAQSLAYPSLNMKKEEDWTRYQVVFNTLDNSNCNVYIGIWGGAGGQLWLDEVKLEEIGMVNLVRREGCPLTVKGEDGTLYKEGTDYAPVKDSMLGNAANSGGFDLYHTPPSIHLLPGSRIHEGQKLLVSYYHAAFTYDMQVTCCLTDPKVYAIMRDQMQRIEKLFHPSAVMLGYDEIRVADWCELCQAKKETPGQLLAKSVHRCEEMVHKIMPQSRIYIWSDMFDPYHNAHGNYYLVNGSWAGSWKGLSPDTNVIDWNFDVRKNDLPFFAARGHRQILAGYYDNTANPGYIRQWLDDAKGIKGVDGVMYTTWRQNYDDMEKFANAAWGGKP